MSQTHAEVALPRLELWVDPSCPWAWQTARWLRDLRDRGTFSIAWRLFSLELNASDPTLSFWDASPLHGELHVALALAEEEGGQEAFETLYSAYGELRHDQHHDRSHDLFRKATAAAGMADLIDRAIERPAMAQRVIDAFQLARARSVFGVPTLALDGTKALFGPILPIAPSASDALEWWTHVRWLLERPDFFELKRWPRDLKPARRPAAAGPEPA